MLVLVDNNFADRDGMREYLGTARTNRAVLPSTVFEEWFKAKSPDTTRRVQEIACSYPNQIFVLKDTRDLLHMDGNPAGMLLKLIDREQTRDFEPYCQTVVKAPMSPKLEAHFAKHRVNAQEHVGALLPEAHKMMKLFETWDSEFTTQQVSSLRGIVGTGRKLSDDLQNLTVEKAFQLGGNLFVAHAVDRSKIPSTCAEMANLLAVRYGFMTVALYVHMRSASSMTPTSDKRVLNQLMDIKIAAQATYFDGFMTNEPDLDIIYQIGLGIVRALGGYSDCGRGRVSHAR